MSNDVFHDVLRRPRLLLIAGGVVAIVSFFAMTWIDLIFIRATGFDLARSTSYGGGQTSLLWSVVAAATVAIGAALSARRSMALLAGLLSLAGVGVLLYGVVLAAQGTDLLGRRLSLLGYLGIGFWSALAALVMTSAGSYL